LILGVSFLFKKLKFSTKNKEVKNNEDEEETKSSLSGPLVLGSDVPEQVGHGLLVVDPTDGLADQQADVHRLDLVALHLLHLVGHGVGHYHLVDERAVDNARRIRREQAMRGHDVNLVGAALAQDLGRPRERLHVVDHVLYDNRNPPANVAHHIHGQLLFGVVAHRDCQVGQLEHRLARADVVGFKKARGILKGVKSYLNKYFFGAKTVRSVQSIPVQLTRIWYQECWRRVATVLAITFRLQFLLQLAVNDSNAQAEALCKGGRSFGLARVSGHDHRIPVVRYLRLDVVDQKGRCSQVVHGHVEEALDLFVKV